MRTVVRPDKLRILHMCICSCASSSRGGGGGGGGGAAHNAHWLSSDSSNSSSSMGCVGIYFQLPVHCLFVMVWETHAHCDHCMG